MTTSPSSANQAVAEEIAVLMARRGRMTNKELAEATGIEKSTLGRKLKGAPFKVDELEAIAAYFDVPIVIDLVVLLAGAAWLLSSAHPTLVLR